MYLEFKKIITIASSFILALPFYASAQILEDRTRQDIVGQTTAMGFSAGMNTLSKTGSVLTVVIKAFFSVMGIVFLILILHAGYKWMSANGDKAAVDEAKNSIQRAVIGLAVMIAAYAITAFVFNQIDQIQ